MTLFVCSLLRADVCAVLSLRDAAVHRCSCAAGAIHPQPVSVGETVILLHTYLYL